MSMAATVLVSMIARSLVALLESWDSMFLGFRGSSALWHDPKPAGSWGHTTEATQRSPQVDPIFKSTCRLSCLWNCQRDLQVFVYEATSRLILPRRSSGIPGRPNSLNSTQYTSCQKRWTSTGCGDLPPPSSPLRLRPRLSRGGGKRLQAWQLFGTWLPGLPATPPTRNQVNTPHASSVLERYSVITRYIAPRWWIYGQSLKQSG